MKLMKETRKLTKEQAEKYLQFKEKYEPYECCRSLHCYEDNCIFWIRDTCITKEVLKHATKHNLTPEQSYTKWRGVLKSIVEGDK